MIDMETDDDVVVVVVVDPEKSTDALIGFSHWILPGVESLLSLAAQQLRSVESVGAAGGQ